MREEDWFRWKLRKYASPADTPPKASPVWEAIARAYRETGKARPSQLEVAGKLDRSEGTLRRWLRGLGMRWTDVHAKMNAAK